MYSGKGEPDPSELFGAEYDITWRDPNHVFTFNSFDDWYMIAITAWDGELHSAELSEDSAWFFLCWCDEGHSICDVPWWHSQIVVERPPGGNALDLFPVVLSGTYSTYWSEAPETFSVTVRFAGELTIEPAEGQITALGENPSSPFYLYFSSSVSARSRSAGKGQEIGGYGKTVSDDDQDGEWTQLSPYGYFGDVSKAGTFTVIRSPHADGGDERSATLTVVEIKELTATVDGTGGDEEEAVTVTSKTNEPGNAETLVISKTDTDSTSVTLTATPNPGNAWPEDWPEWKINDQTDASATGTASYQFNTAERAPGVYTITAECGISRKSIKVIVANIVIKEGTTIVSDGTARNRIAGQKMSLTAEIFPADLSVSSKKWTIPGTRIKNYTAVDSSTDSSAVSTPISAVDLQESNIAYYWVDGEDARNVKFSASIDLGGNRKFETEATAVYNVKRPTATLTTQTSEVSIIDIPNQGKYLIFMAEDRSANGIVFTASVDTPAGFTGESAFWQVVKTSHIVLDETHYAQIDKLDTSLPYEALPQAADSPRIALNDHLTSVYRAESFQMWVMFKPAVRDSIWVPLRAVEWNFYGDARRVNGKWTLIASDNSEDPESTETVEFPEWNGNIKSREE